MRSHNELSINNKLALINIVVLLVVILTASFIYISGYIYTSRISFVEALVSSGDIVSLNSQTPLLSSDRASVAQALQSFEVIPSVRYAAIFDGKNIKVSEYGVVEQEGLERIKKNLLTLPSSDLAETFSAGSWWGDIKQTLTNQHVEVTRPIMLNGQRLGTLYIFAEVTPLFSQIRGFLVFSVVALLVSVFVSWFLARSLFGRISRPLAALATRVNHVLEGDNSHAKHAPQNADILDGLVTGFDHVQERVKQRENRLEEYCHQLEAKLVDSEDILAANKTLEKEVSDMQCAKADIEAEKYAKNELLATLSHEVRAPMNGVLGMTQLLGKTSLDNRQKHYVKVAQDSGKVLLNTVNNILDFSKMEVGALEIESISFNLAELMEDTVFLLAERARIKGVKLVCIVPGGLNTYLIGDEGRLHQVLMGLIGYVVKLAQQVEVVVSASFTHRKEGLVDVSLTVSDVGVAGDQQGVISVFSQADNAHAITDEDTDLGLAIAQRFVTLMGGGIDCKSEEGIGSVFTVSLPLKKGRELQSRDVDISSLQHTRALIVDDNQTNRLFLEQTLSNCGVKCGLFSDAKKALAHLMTTSEYGVYYDYAILDMVMPGMDGVRLATAIRQDARFAKLPLMLLSSDYFQTSSGMTSKLFDCTMTKPVRQNQLLVNIVSMLMLVEGFPSLELRVARAEEALVNKLKGIEVLLVEDTLSNQCVASAMLADLGVITTAVTSGEQAIELFRKKTFDVILMDCQMPGKDGYQTTGEIREIEGEHRCSETPHSETPIVALTANAMREDREKCLAAGMTEYLSKPISIEGLKSVLGKVLDEPRGSCSAPSTTELAEDVSVDGGASGLLDETILNELKQICGDENTFVQVLQLYLDESTEKMKVLSKAGERGDWEAVAGVAHTMKSSSMNVGAMSLGEMFKRLEAESKVENTGVITPLLARLPEFYEDVVVQLREKISVSS